MMFEKTTNLDERNNVIDFDNEKRVYIHEAQVHASNSLFVKNYEREERENRIVLIWLTMHFLIHRSNNSVTAVMHFLCTTEDLAPPKHDRENSLLYFIFLRDSAVEWKQL